MRSVIRLFLLAILVVFSFSKESPAAAGWIDAAHVYHTGVCTVSGSSEYPLESWVGYWGDIAGAGPKVGEVYYAHAVSANISGCSNVLAHPELSLPPNTVPMVSVSYPIKCYTTKYNVNPAQVTEVTGTSGANYSCPTSLLTGTYGTYWLGWATLPPGWLWEVWVPVASTATLNGIGSANDRFYAYFQATGAQATISPAWQSAFVWTTVFANTPTIAYPSPATTDIATTSAKSNAIINNHYTTGNLFFDIGLSTAYGTSMGPYSIGAVDSATAYQNWINLTPGTTYYWRARFVTSTGSTINGAGQTFTTTAGTVSNADLSLSLIATPNPVGQGNQLTYTVTVMNNGPAQANNVTVSTTGAAPFPVFGAAVAPGCNLSIAGIWSCSFGSLAAGASASGYVTGFVNTLGSASLTATAATTSNDPNAANNSATATATVVTPSADLSLSITDSPDPVLTGGSLTYTITAANAGPTTAMGVTISASIPNTATYASKSPICNLSGSNLTCSLISGLASGANETVTLVVTPQSAGALTFQASVTSTTSDPNSANNTASATTTVNAPQGGTTASADVSVSILDSPDPVTTGGNLTYSMTVTNNGPASAGSVSLAATLPNTTTFVSITPTSCIRSGSSVNCAIGTLASGASSAVILVVTPQQTGSLTFSASATTTTIDPNSANNAVSVTTTVNAPQTGAGSMTITLGGNSPITAVSAKGATNVPLIQARLAAASGGENAVVSRLTVIAGGTGNDASDVTAVKVYRDANGNGMVDTNEAVIASGAFIADNGSVELVLSQPLAVNAGSSADFLIAYDFSATLAGLWLLGPASIMLIGMVGAVRPRRGRLAFLAVAAAMLMGFLGACGGDGPGGNGGVLNAGATATYQATITGVNATGAATSQPLTVSGLPLAGGTITINK